MITVRQATADDLDALLRLGLKFVDCSPFAHMVDSQEVRYAVSRMIDASPDAATVLVAETAPGRIVGTLIAVLTTMWFSSTPIACELAWWVEPEARSSSAAWRLMAQYEQWATDHKAAFMTMSDMTGGGTSDMEAAYLKRGFVLLERSYRKEL